MNRYSRLTASSSAVRHQARNGKNVPTKLMAAAMIPPGWARLILTLFCVLPFQRGHRRGLPYRLFMLKNRNSIGAKTLVVHHRRGLSASGPKGVDERENTRLAAMGLQQAEIRYEKSPAAHRSDDKAPATPKRAAGRHAREGKKPSAVVSGLDA
jgi:hypothetical protein